MPFISFSTYMSLPIHRPCVNGLFLDNRDQLCHKEFLCYFTSPPKCFPTILNIFKRKEIMGLYFKEHCRSEIPENRKSCRLSRDMRCLSISNQGPLGLESNKHVSTAKLRTNDNLKFGRAQPTLRLGLWLTILFGGA